VCYRAARVAFVGSTWCTRKRQQAMFTINSLFTKGDEVECSGMVGHMVGHSRAHGRT
jgi:hypothetical protein